MFAKTPSSEISRLVLGYLLDAKCHQTALTFLRECDHFKLCTNQLQQFISNKTDISSFDLNVFGETLLTILNEHSEIKARMNKTMIELGGPLQHVVKQRLDFTGTEFQLFRNEDKEVNRRTQMCDSSFSVGNQAQPVTSSHNIIRDSRKNKNRARKLKAPKKFLDIMKDSDRSLTEAEFHSQINSRNNAGEDCQSLNSSTLSPPSPATCRDVSMHDETESLDESSTVNQQRSTKKGSSINLRAFVANSTEQGATSSGNKTVTHATPPTREAISSSTATSTSPLQETYQKKFTNIPGFLFASATVPSTQCETDGQRSVSNRNRPTTPNYKSISIENPTSKKVTCENVDAGNLPSDSSLAEVVENLRTPLAKNAVPKVNPVKDTIPEEVKRIKNAEAQETVTNEAEPRVTVAKDAVPNVIGSTDAVQSILTVELDELDQDESVMSIEPPPAPIEVKRSSRKRKARIVFDASPTKKYTVPRTFMEKIPKKVTFDSLLQPRYAANKTPVVIKVNSSPRNKRMLDRVTVCVDPSISDKDAVMQLVNKIKKTDELAKK